jgi:hypothetical protein
MLFSAYDSDALDLLAPARFEAMAILYKSAPRTLTDSEKDYFREKIAQNLGNAYDAGERDPSELDRAALRGVFVSHNPL